MLKKIEYLIKSEQLPDQSFFVEVDENSHLIPDDDSIDGPDWTLLKNNKCFHCPYMENDKKYCPVAKNLSSASEAFRENKSFQKVTVFVKTDERFYGKNTDLQTALFSLFGLIMASSNCPHLQMFKTMVKFHLPFSTVQETIVRALGMYLIGEYLQQQEHKDYKIDLDNLTKKYLNIAEVNRGIISRIRTLKGGDATKNAVIVLDNFASILPLEISSGLSEIKNLFTPT